MIANDLSRPGVLAHISGSCANFVIGVTQGEGLRAYFLTELQRLFPLFRGQVSACPGMVLPHGGRG
jgi:hypothetical protein